MEPGGLPHQVLNPPRRKSSTPLQSPLSNTLIPRDFLSQSSPVRGLSATGIHSLPATPSSSLPPTPSSDVDLALRSFSSSATMPSITNPHSPRPLQSIESPEPSPRTRRAQNGPPGEKKSQVTKPQVGQSIPSPPRSPLSVDFTSRDDQKRINMADFPRNGSIDSTLSMSSSAEHSHKSSNDSSLATSSEIRHLIATAGSAEALVSHLLKENHQAQSRSTQLWKLVDKQRSLLMGLNQDLERAIRDKEKYRKRARELQETDTAPSQLSPTTAVAEKQQAPSIPPPSAPRGANNSEADQRFLDHPDRPSHGEQASPLDRSMLPSPLHLAQSQPHININNAAETTGRKEEQVVPSTSLDDLPISAPVTSHDLQQSFTNANIAQPISSTSLPTSPLPLHAGSRSNTLPLPADPANSQLTKPLPPTRKAPPAPLNLDQAKPSGSLPQPVASAASAHLQLDDAHPILANASDERGRRRTREEDDRDRDLVGGQADHPARSRSNKSSKASRSKAKNSKMDAKPEGQAHGPPTAPAKELPASPRKVVITPPAEDCAADLADGGDHKAPNSIAEILSPAVDKVDTLSTRTLIASPLSPGLPSSPRPVDRPLGSPTPRLPKDGTGLPSPPSVPRRGTMADPPTSPRIVEPARVVSVRVVQPQTSTGLPSPEPRQQHFQQPRSPTQHNSPTEDRTRSKGPPGNVYEGLQIDQSLRDVSFPNLLLPPSALRSIAIRVSSSRLRPSRNSYMFSKPTEEDPVFTLSIFRRSESRELWRVEKVILALPHLDHQINDASKLGIKLPERKLFSGHSPAVVDARRVALNRYFEQLLEAAVEEKSALILCQFLSKDVIEARDDESNLLSVTPRGRPTPTAKPDGRLVKEGYLTKRGKNFGGWKVRYFTLQGHSLKYFEAPGGTQLGTIRLQKAQIGKQSQSQSPSRLDDDAENQYRHAFLVLEPKRKDSSNLVRHVLCAESDQERDAWVLALTQHVDETPSEDEPTKQEAGPRADEGRLQEVRGDEGSGKFSDQSNMPLAVEQRGDTGTNVLKGMGYGQMSAGSAPTMGSQHTSRRQEATPSPGSTHETTSSHDGHTPSHSSKAIAAIKNGSVMQDVGSWGNKLLSQTTTVKEKKRSIWGFRQRVTADDGQNGHSGGHEGHGLSSLQRHGRAVFGLPLWEAVQYCPPLGVETNSHLPSVVYRCIEHLRVNDAASEEGIFRLSGSSLVIKALRERFNTEGDIDLLEEDQSCDVHAVASLFKSYLRELPSTVLTRDLHLEFLQVLDLDDKDRRVAAFNVLVHRLPSVNFALLRAVSHYLLDIINNSDQNKMTLRNMGIVFSPTLNIPAPVFSMFLTDFEAIFGSESAARNLEQDMSQPTEAVPERTSQERNEESRSPRQAVFPSQPTANHSQTSVSRAAPPSQFPMPEGVSNPRTSVVVDINNDAGSKGAPPPYESVAGGTDRQSIAQAHRRYSMMPPPPGTAPRAEYGSMSMMMAPSNASSAKGKRRESSMLSMGALQQKGSLSKLRDESRESGMVPDDPLGLH